MERIGAFGETVLLKDRVYEAIKSEIILGNLRPGEKLNILELANKMNISCAPVREALNILAKDGLVNLAPHRQATVAESSPAEYEASFALRKMIEPYAAKLSIHNIPQSEIDRVRKMLEDVLAEPTNMARYVESDNALHDLLHLYSGSKILSDVMNQLKAYNMYYRYKTEKTAPSLVAKAETTICSTKEHMQILDAVESSDGDRLYDVVLRHIDGSYNRNHMEN